MYYEAIDTWNSPYLEHHGVKGMKWGVRKKYYEYVKNRNNLYREKMYKKTGNYRYKRISDSTIQKERRIKLARNILIGTAAVAVTGLAVYGATKLGREYTDTVLKSGKDLKIVAANGNRAFNRAFYATDNAKDALKYRGLYAGQQLGGMGGKDVYSYTLKNTGSNLKIAGKYQAQKVFNELRKTNPEFAKSADERINLMNANRLLEGALPTGSYDAFNRSLAEHSNPKAAQTFYKALADKGYAGVKDINDAKFSGYNSKRAVIYFDKFSNLKVNEITKLDKRSMQNDYKKAMKMIQSEANIPVSLIGGGTTSTAGALYLNKKNRY